MASKEKYSVILPTYNERRNLPIITWLLARTFTEKYALYLIGHSNHGWPRFLVIVRNNDIVKVSLTGR